MVALQETLIDAYKKQLSDVRTVNDFDADYVVVHVPRSDQRRAGDLQKRRAFYEPGVSVKSFPRSTMLVVKELMSYLT